MNKILLMTPVFGMVLLTVGIALWMLKLRYRAVMQDGVSVSYFKFNRGAELPDYLMRVTQHYDNLFETPLLFYIVVLFVLVLNANDMVYVVLAWSYFVSRMVHAYVHTTRNKVLVRRNAFIVSSIILLCLWAKLVIDVFTN